MTNDQFIRLLTIYTGHDEATVIDQLITETREKNESKLSNIMDLLEAIWQPSMAKPEVKPTIATIETPEKIRKKPGRKPKNFVEDTIREVRQAEKMSKEEFVEYFGGKA